MDRAGRAGVRQRGEAGAPAPSEDRLGPAADVLLGPETLRLLLRALLGGCARCDTRFHLEQLEGDVARLRGSGRRCRGGSGGGGGGGGGGGTIVVLLVVGDIVVGHVLVVRHRSDGHSSGDSCGAGLLLVLVPPRLARGMLAPGRSCRSGRGKGADSRNLGEAVTNGHDVEEAVVVFVVVEAVQVDILKDAVGMPLRAVPVALLRW